MTRACIESLYAQVGSLLGEVYVHDNASGDETREMLDSLQYPRLRVVHAARNTGFGDAVNRGVRATRSDPVLVLNSDVRAADDFLSPLAHALERHASLAALTPAGNSFDSYDLDRYAARDDCVATHNLYAYAFLIRRKAFETVGGFDPSFGLGYYEDSDLSRKLIAQGYWLAVHRSSILHHEVHGSFEGVTGARELMAKNRSLYFARYPRARRRILLLSIEEHARRLPGNALEACDEALADGAEIHWLARTAPTHLPALGMRGERLRIARTIRTLVKRRRKPFGRYTDLWAVDPAPTGHRLIAHVAKRLGLAQRRFDGGH